MFQYEREEHLGGPWAHTSTTALWACDSRLALLTVLISFIHQNLTPLQMRDDRPLLTSPAIKPSGAFQGMMNSSLSSKEANNLLLFSWMLDVFPWAESQWLSLLPVCLLNLCILTRGLGGGLFSLEGEGYNFHFFPLVFLPLGKVPPWSLSVDNLLSASGKASCEEHILQWTKRPLAAGHTTQNRYPWSGGQLSPLPMMGSAFPFPCLHTAPSKKEVSYLSL